MGNGWPIRATGGLGLALVASLCFTAPSAAVSDPTTYPIVVDLDQGYWYTHDDASQPRGIYYGNPGDIPFTGDWDCDGLDSPGMYRSSDGYVYLRNSSSQGVADIRFYFGNPGDIPLPGDFDGDGCDSVSLYRPAERRVYIINRLGSEDGGLGAADFDYSLGSHGVQPITGDWDNDGFDTVGFYNPVTARFTFERSLGGSLTGFTFGNPGDKAVSGDWDGDGADELGVFRPATRRFYLRVAVDDVRATKSLGEADWYPVAGAVDVTSMKATSVRWPLAPGAVGTDVADLQRSLTDAAFYRGPIDGIFGRRTAAAVVAFHKVTRADRTSTWAPSDWNTLVSIDDLGIPARPLEPTRLEADLTRQVLFFIDQGELAGVFPISSGGGYLYWSERNQQWVRARTPKGRFFLKWFNPGWREDVTTGWWLYNYWAFTDFYGLHGYASVPTYPASHGCVRVHTWNADWLAERLFVGIPLHIWD